MTLKKTCSFLVGAFLLAGSAFAEPITLTNKISEIGTSDDYFKMYHLNPQTQDSEEVRIEIEESTLFKGAESIRSFSVGDVVRVQAEENPFTHEVAAQVIERAATQVK